MKNSVSGLIVSGIDLPPMLLDELEFLLEVALDGLPKHAVAAAGRPTPSSTLRARPSARSANWTIAEVGEDVLDDPALVDVTTAAELEQVVVLAERDLGGLRPLLASPCGSSRSP